MTLPTAKWFNSQNFSGVAGRCECGHAFIAFTRIDRLQHAVDDEPDETAHLKAIQIALSYQDELAYAYNDLITEHIFGNDDDQKMPLRDR